MSAADREPGTRDAGRARRDARQASGGSEPLEARLAALEGRVAELADLVAELAAQPAVAADDQLLEAVLRRFLPEEAIGHMKTARREDMLALRSILDAWIARLERGREEKPPPRRRESISLE